MESKTNKTSEPLFCGGCAHSRRTFLSNCAKCIGVVGVSSLTIPDILAGESFSPKHSIMKVRVVFAVLDAIQVKPDWPNIGFDFNPVMENTMNALERGCREIDFVQSMVDNRENAANIVAADNAAGDIDGYLIVQLNTALQIQINQQFTGTGKPSLYTDFLYAGSGRFVHTTAQHLRAGVPNFAHMSSGNLSHLVAAANCFTLAKGPGGVKAFVDGVTKVRKDIVSKVLVDMKCLDDKIDLLSTADLLKELKTKKMLAYETGRDIAQAAKETLGIEVIRRPFAELNEQWEKADKDQALEIAKKWKNSATGVIGVSDQTLHDSARMYLAQKQCLKMHDACAITVNCLGGFYGGHIHAYPCLGFHELLNEGLIGACECDTISTLTMVVMTTLTKGRPGYISDPVMDVATKQIIYAHCVMSNKPFGPKGATNPFSIMTHSEDRKGASLRSMLPVGYMTTTLEMNPLRKEILFHQGKAVDNILEDRACRTKLAVVPVGDYEKLFTEWDVWGWHRVTYYGDLKKPVFDLAAAIGWKVVEET